MTQTSDPLLVQGSLHAGASEQILDSTQALSEPCPLNLNIINCWRG